MEIHALHIRATDPAYQSFAAVSRASSEQLQNLPGFGQVKAKRIQDAFNKPFRNSSTSVVPISSQIQFRASQQAAGSQADKGKGKEVDSEAEGTPAPGADELRAPSPPRPPPAPRPLAPRASSPTWDIELDLNSSPEPESGPPPVRKRPPSPVWDMELDLNPTDTEDDVDERREDGRERKRPREGSGEFGAPSMLTTS